MTLASIEPGTAGFSELRRWLDGERLATDDLAEGNPRFFRLSGADGLAIGFAGITGAGADCLLRSVVISPAARGTGGGTRLVAAVEAEARADGAASLWLLTQGAAPFSPRSATRRPSGRRHRPSSVRARNFRGSAPPLRC